MDIRRFGGRLRAWLPLLPLIALLYGSYWLSLQVQPLPSSKKVVSHDVDFVVEKLSSTSLNAQGMPSFTLSTEKMWHFADDDNTHLQFPRFISLSAARSPLEVSAQLGVLNGKSEEVVMQDAVVVKRFDPVTASEKRFETEYLHLVPDREWADTDRPVLMYGKNNTISAQGMVIDGRARTVKLLSKVRAKHETSQ